MESYRLLFKRSVAKDLRAIPVADLERLLERRFGDRQDEWRMLADKAARWMAGQAVALPAGETSWAGWAVVACGVG